MIMDYEIEIMLRQSVPGYGKSILMVVSAADTAAAQEEAKGKYAAMTGLPLYLIESVEAAPIIPLSKEKNMGKSWKHSTNA